MCAQGIEFDRLIVAGIDHGRDEFVVHQEGRVLGVDIPLDRLPLLGWHGRHRAHHHPARDRRPVDLRDLPWITQVGAETGRRCQHRCIHGHAVGLDVVGMAVAAEIVVGDHHLGSDLTNHRHEVGGRLEQVRAPEAVRSVVGWRADHAAVAVVAITAETTMIRNSQNLHGCGQLGEPMRAQSVVVLGGQVRQLRQQHLPLFTESARDQRDVHALGGVGGHGAASGERFVVRMRVHEQQATISGSSGLIHGHRL